MAAQIKIETITPAMAAKMLEINTNNRPLRRTRVELYADRMLNGSWMMTGEPIILNGTTLINGQHRLAACVMADVPFTTAVFRDAEPEIYKIIDTGLGRSMGDVLKHEGVNHYSLTAAASKMVLQYESGTMHDNHSAAFVVTREAMLAEVVGHRDRYEVACDLAWQGRKEGHTASAVASFVVLLGRAIDPELADEWTATAISGVGIELGDPRLALRRWIVSAPRGSGGPVHLSAWIRTRNAYANNESRTLIRPWFKGQAFPRLVES